MKFIKKYKKILFILAVFFSVNAFFGVRMVLAETFCICTGEGTNNPGEVGTKEIFKESGSCGTLCVGKSGAGYTGGFDTNAKNAGELNDTAEEVDKAYEEDKGWMQEALEWIVKKLLLAVLILVGWLVLIAVAILKWILDPATFSIFLNSDAIRDVWVMTRDFLNIGFIFVLLFSAFCTIFQIDKYHIKSILFKLILMALLVNFSFPIARFVIDISNVTMYWLLNNIFEGLNDGAGLFASISGKSGITELLLPQGTDAASIQHMLAAISFSFVFGITLLIIAVMFVIRLIALGIIVMFSPIGFAAAAFPMVSQYASKWWEALFKYSFFAPIMIFMLAVALKIMAAAANSENEKAMLDAAGAQTIGHDMAIFVAKAAMFTIPIVVLWIGMGIAQTLSVAGAAAVTGKGQQLAKWAGRQPWRGTKALSIAGAKKFDRDVLAPKGLSPRAFKTAWKARTQEVEDRALRPAEGAWRDRMNNVFSLGKEKTRYKEAADQALILKKQKDLSDVSQESEYLMKEFESAEKSKDTHKMAAVLRIMFNNNDQNEFMKLSGKEVDPYKMKKEVFDRLTAAGMSKEEAAKQLADYSEVAVSKGNFANYGMASLNTTTGKFEVSSDNNQCGAAIAKASNIKAQTKADIWHWNSFLTQNPDHSTGHLHEIGKQQLLNLKGLEINQLNRVRPDFVQKLDERHGEIKKVADDIRAVNPAQAALIDEFADKIRKMKNDPKFK